MEDAKAELERKISKTLKLIHNKDRIPKDSKKELLALVKDFQEQYHSLYSNYEQLKANPERKSHVRKEKVNSSSTSSSDIEYYSSEELETNNSNLENESLNVAISLKEEFETANLEVADLKHKLASATEEKEALNSHYMAALAKLQEAEILNKHLKNEADEKEKELCALAKLNEIREDQASSLIKELEGQLTGLNIELQSQCNQKRDLEEQIGNKITEAKQLEENNEGLHSRILELELVSKEKADEISNLLEKLRDNENNSMSVVEDLMTLVSDVQLEVDFLCSQKDELAGSVLSKKNEVGDQFKGLMDKLNIMQHKVASLWSHTGGKEFQLDIKSKEIPQNLIQVKTLTEELASKTKAEQIMLEEKEGFLVKIKDLELKVVYLHRDKNDLEEQIRSKIHETSQLREEKDGLHARIIELERQFTERGDESHTLEEIDEIKEDAASQIMALNEQVDHLQEELDSLQVQKSELELLIEREKKKHLESLIQMEDENIKLASQITDQRRILKEKDDIINKFMEDQKLMKRWSLGSRDCKLNTQILERKMEELAEDFRMKMEDHIRLLYRRIHVAEQIHIENRNNYRKTKEEGGQDTVATNEAQVRKLKDMLYTGLDLVLRKLEDTGNFISRISKISDDLQLAKNWITDKNKEIEQLKHSVHSLAAQLDKKEGQELLLREKLTELEANLRKEGGDKLSLMKAVNQLEKQVEEWENRIKEKDELFLGLAEEKREAIRQLCFLIDYHQSRYDHLKRSVAEMNSRPRQ